MRQVLYDAIRGLFGQTISVAIGIGGIAATLWPDKFKTWASGVMTTEQIQHYGLAGVAIIICYWVFLARLKPKDTVPASPQTSYGDNSPNLAGTFNGPVMVGGTVNIGVSEPNMLYQDGRRVAKVVNGSFTNEQEDEILFQQILFTDSADTTKPIQFQGVSLLCDTPSVTATALMFMNLVENVRCRIVK